jgi:hypothetical protein
MLDMLCLSAPECNILYGHMHLELAGVGMLLRDLECQP